MDLLITLLLSAAVQILLFLYLRGRINQQLNATDLLKNVQQEIDAMVRELNVSAERNIGVLEARLAEMDELLAKADQKVLVLSKELERRERTSEVYTQLKKVVPDLPEPNPLAPAAVVERAPAPAPSPAPAAPVPANLSLDLPPPEPKTLKQRVVELRVAGRSAAEIAAATGATLGEVELILSLHQGFSPSA